MLEDHLAIAERHIGLGRVVLRRQIKLIADMECARLDTTDARNLLEQFKRLQQMHCEDRDRLRTELGLPPTEAEISNRANDPRIDRSNELTRQTEERGLQPAKTQVSNAPEPGSKSADLLVQQADELARKTVELIGQTRRDVKSLTESIHETRDRNEKSVQLSRECSKSVQRADAAHDR